MMHALQNYLSCLIQHCGYIWSHVLRIYPSNKQSRPLSGYKHAVFTRCIFFVDWPKYCAVSKLLARNKLERSWHRGSAQITPNIFSLLLVTLYQRIFCKCYLYEKDTEIFNLLIKISVADIMLQLIFGSQCFVNMAARSLFNTLRNKCAPCNLSSLPIKRFIDKVLVWLLKSLQPIKCRVVFG